MSYCPLLIFTLDFCLAYISKSIKARNLKLHTHIELIEEKCLHKNHNSIFSIFRVIALCKFLLWIFVCTFPFRFTGFFLTDYPLMSLSCSGTSASLFFILIIPLVGDGDTVIVSVSPSFVPHFYPEDNLNNISDTNFKLCKWIDLIKEECSVHE